MPLTDARPRTSFWRAGRDGPLPSWSRPGRGRDHGHHYRTRIVIMTIEPIDCYAILGLARDATQAQISAAIRTLLRRYHPDTPAHPPAAHATRSPMRRSSRSSAPTRSSTTPPPLRLRPADHPANRTRPHASTSDRPVTDTSVRRSTPASGPVHWTP